MIIQTKYGKFMKKTLYFTIVSTVLFLNGCNVFKTEMFRSFVIRYYEPQNLFMFETPSGNIVVNYGETNLICDWKSKGRQKELYDSLCRANNDISYNKEISYYPDPHAGDGVIDLSINRVAKIDVTSNADFDEQHPAGTSLNDIIRFMGISVYEFLQSNYRYSHNWDIKPEGFEDELYSYSQSFHSPVTGLLSELQTDDMILLDNVGLLHFEKVPTLSKTHELIITVTLDNGKILSGYSQDKSFNKYPNIIKEFE